MKSIHAIITGKVQGVFFRDSTQKQACSLSITGWVRNNSDGSVELKASGTYDNIEQFKAWLYEGPTQARVDHIEFHDIEFKLFDEFIIK